jgi:hypothetical protein
MPEETKDFRLQVGVKVNASFGDRHLSFRAEVVERRANGQPYGLSCGWTDLERGLDNLGVTAQASVGIGTEHFYGYELEYLEPYTVNARRLDAMSKTMRRLTAKLEKMAATLGSPEDLPAFMARVAVALGITKAPFMVLVDADHDFQGTGYREMDADTLRYWIGEQLKKLAPESLEATA